MQSENTRTCARCGKALDNHRQHGQKYCSFKCYRGGEFRLDYLLRVGKDPNQNECLLWPFSTNSQGRGIVWDGEKLMQAHVMSYISFVGPTDGLCVLHRCDVSLCFNYHHLFLGTRLDNAIDRDSKGRGIKGMKVHSCKLTPEQVIEIRSLWRPSDNAGELARRFGVTTTTIYLIATGQSQRHIPMPQR